MQFDFPLQVRENHFRVSAEFPDDLAARSAGRRERIGVGHHGDGVKSALAFGNGLKNRDALGAKRQAVRRVLHVAAAENPSGFRAHRRAHAEI